MGFQSLDQDAPIPTHFYTASKALTTIIYFQVATKTSYSQISRSPILPLSRITNQSAD
jgi:hypothetical protein